MIRKYYDAWTAGEEGGGGSACTPDQCVAEQFRRQNPDYSFSTIGFGYPPKELAEEYMKMVDFKYESYFRGTEEFHYCKSCRKEVYNRIHR